MTTSGSKHATEPAARHTIEHARSLDAQDPLAKYRDQFEFPTNDAGEPLRYFSGNSLGLQPKTVRPMLEQELHDWAKLAVDAHFDAVRPWFSYHELFREPGARLVGAKPGEVVMMNSLTVNLHLLMVTFYQPTANRNKVLLEYPAFPSDLYAVQSHLNARGVNADEAILAVRPNEGEHTISADQVDDMLKEHGDSIALILIGGVNFLTGQVVDMPRITELGHRHGCTVGFDLAHAAGNIAMHLHDWNVDFAAWCSYKYLNSGPGAVAGCFVHERHGVNTHLPRFAGWWGNDPESRFRMHLESKFIARPGADGWQISNPPVFAMTPLKASLDMFDEVGMEKLRAKSIKLTGYLRDLLEKWNSGAFEIITPEATNAHGCQLSILVHDQAEQRMRELKQAGVVCDFRPPNVLRVAPTPLYNSFEDVWTFANIFTGRSRTPT